MCPQGDTVKLLQTQFPGPGVIYSRYFLRSYPSPRIDDAQTRVARVNKAEAGLTFPSRCDAGLQTLSPLLFAPAAPFSLHASVSPLTPPSDGPLPSERRSRSARPLLIPPLVRLEVLERHRGGLLERVGRVLDARVVETLTRGIPRLALPHARVRKGGSLHGPRTRAGKVTKRRRPANPCRRVTAVRVGDEPLSRYFCTVTQKQRNSTRLMRKSR